MPHQLVRALEAGCLDADDEVFRSAHFLQCRTHEVTDLLVGQLCPWVWRDDNRIAAFNGVNALNDGGRFGVGRGCQRTNNAERLRQHANISLRIFLDHANGLVVDNIEQGRASFTLYFEELTVVVTQLGLINRELRNLLGDPGARYRPDHGSDQRIDLLLRVVLYLLLRRSGTRNQLRDIRLGVATIL